MGREKMKFSYRLYACVYFLTYGIAISTSDDEGNNFGEIPCTVNPRVTIMTDGILKTCRSSIQHEQKLMDQQMDDKSRLTGGTSVGWSRLVPASPLSSRCYKGNNTAIFSLDLGHHVLGINFTLTYEKLAPGHLLGDEMDRVAAIMYELVRGADDTVVGFGVMNVVGRLEFQQQLVQGAKCRVTSYDLVNIGPITLLSIDVPVASAMLTSYFEPAVRSAIEQVFPGYAYDILTREFGSLSIPMDMITF